MMVSIIIVNYNTHNFVFECIKSIYKNTQNLTYEIIIIDNNSPSREIENLNIEFPDVIFIKNSINSGFGSANNLASKRAHGKYLFFLNPDTLLINNAILELFNFMELNQNAGACGGNLFTKDLLPNMSFSDFMPGFENEINFLTFGFYGKLLKKNKNFNNTDSNKIVKGFISGADLMIKADVFNQLGGFDQEFFMYYEETELIFRIRKLGFAIFSVPKSHIVHYEGASEMIKEKTFERMKLSEKIYYRKTGKTWVIYVSHYFRLFRFSIMKNVYLLKGNLTKAEILNSMICFSKKYKGF